MIPRPSELPRALAGRSDAERGGEGRPEGPGAGEGSEMGGPR
jgi:hypothetical protein